MSVWRIVGQVLAWVAFAVPVGLLAQWPYFAPLPAGHAELRLSLAHLTERLEPCRPLSADERAALPANMRVLERCGRPRAPALIELMLDEQVLLRVHVRPAGLHRDGRAYLHRTWSLPAGSYRLQLNLRDSPRQEGFDQQQFWLDLQPGVSTLLRVGDGEAVLSSSSPADSPVAGRASLPAKASGRASEASTGHQTRQQPTRQEAT